VLHSLGGGGVAGVALIWLLVVHCGFAGEALSGQTVSSNPSSIAKSGLKVSSFTAKILATVAGVIADFAHLI
jgi:hypothetical protein